MQATWSKKIRDWMNLYKTTFQFKPPYRVIIDGNFLYSCVKHSLELLSKLKNIFLE